MALFESSNESALVEVVEMYSGVPVAQSDAGFAHRSTRPIISRGCRKLRLTLFNCIASGLFDSEPNLLEVNCAKYCLYQLQITG